MNLTFTSLAYNTQGYIMAVITISFVACILALITSITAKKGKSLPLALSFLLLAIIIDLSVLMELTYFQRTDGKIPLSSVAKKVNSIPYLFHIILGVGLILVAVYIIYKLYKKSQDNINDFAIKEALESLPTGIAFVSKNNNLYLSNNIMHKLWGELTGKDLINGTDIWEEVSTQKSSEICVINDDAPAFILRSGEVWQFSKTFRKWHSGNYFEIKATNITELYSLRNNTEQVSVVLTKRQERLKTLADIIVKNTEEELAVNMKVGFHDNFGNLLTLTKEILRETPEKDEVKVITGHFSKLSDIITDIASDKEQSLSIDQIILFGRKLGCEVIVNGELPTDDENKTTILLCINEALKNAYCHANANKLNINISQTAETVNVVIHNEAENTLPEITEGGGLTGLRQRVENIGGKLNIKAEDGVTMEITLNKAVLRRKVNV